MTAHVCSLEVNFPLLSCFFHQPNQWQVRQERGTMEETAIHITSAPSCSCGTREARVREKCYAQGKNSDLGILLRLSRGSWGTSTSFKSTYSVSFQGMQPIYLENKSALIHCGFSHINLTVTPWHSAWSVGLKISWRTCLKPR